MDPDRSQPLGPIEPKVYLAAERTFLAWIRTGLALMGFGFVVARFGFFLRELHAARVGSPPTEGVASVRFGTVLVVLGVILTTAAVYRYKHLLGKLASGEQLNQPSRLAMTLGGALAAVGAVAAAHLLLTW